MPKQDRCPGNAEQEHIACIASIHPPARGPSAKQAPFPPPRPPRRTPPGQPGKQGARAEASSACAHRAAAPRTSAQICAVLTKRSCVSCGRAMARATLTSLGPYAPMRRRCKLKSLLRRMDLQGFPSFQTLSRKVGGAAVAAPPTLLLLSSKQKFNLCTERAGSARNPRFGRPLGASPESFFNFWAVYPTNPK